ncbi:MAG TPA: hypothetical protein VNL98_04695 [Gemmatimonadales bacterium]|nr:hypothetical protein [Gemmatimonadales bacterium]
MRKLIRTLAVAALAVPAVAEAQYFGQNKVQYTYFDFQIIQTEHFDVYYYGNFREAALDAARMAERGYARLSRILNHQWRERKPLILYASGTDFSQTNTTYGDIGEATGGFTELFKHRIVLPLTGSYADFEHVLQHELVHAFQYDVFSRGRIGGGFQALAAAQPPLWFMEGMAEYLSIGPVDARTAMWMRDAAIEGRMPTIEQMTLDPYQYFPYRFGHGLWAYIGQKWGDETIGAILQGAVVGGIERSFQRVLGLSLEQLSDEWREAVQNTYLPQVADHERARRFGRMVIDRRRTGGTLHVSPQISPDGRRIAYLSERNFFFVDLHLADAESGRHLRRLVRSNFDPNFESLRFVNSAGSWSPDGTEYVFASKSGPSDVINIVDVRSGRVVQRIRPGVQAVTNPSFSPDGRRIVFSGLNGGWSDLYIIDRDGSNERRLTEDRYADLQPVWSPDGRALAFVTDRGPETDFGILRFGSFRLALYHLEGDSIELLQGMEGNNLNPQWAPDSRSLAFISDRTGIYNLFLFDRDSVETYQLTRAYTGLSGLTDLSPVLSWAREADRLVFTYYERGEYNVYSIDNPRALRREPYRQPTTPMIALANASAQPLRADILGRPQAASDADPRLIPAPAPQQPSGAQLAGGQAPPPATATEPGGVSIYRGSSGALRRSDTGPGGALRDSSQAAPLSVAQLLDSVRLALPDTAEFTSRRYRIRFSPDYVSRPTIGYTRDNFGRGFFGGAAIQLSDILGNHQLSIAAQVNGRISEAQVFTAYANLSRRLNWAVGVAQQPYYYYGTTEYQALPEADVLIYRLRRIVMREVFGQANYPFNRFRRVELGTRLVNVSDASLNIASYYQVGTGAFIGQEEYVTDGTNRYFVQPSIALVFDNSLFGFTSPFYGRRSRFELSRTIGDWSYTQLLGDYRRYDYLGLPFFNLASRLLFLGRFGRNENEFPVFLGSSELVRGYTYASFRRSECGTTAVQSLSGCGAVDQLIGSRIAVANIELRVPLIRNLTLGVLPIGFPPIEGALWFDAGVAWTAGSNVRWSRSPEEDQSVRAPVSSYGVGLRANILGFLILRVDYAVPRQRPQQGGYWIVSLGPPF